MKILKSEETAMPAVEKGPAWEYVFCMLASVVYWLNVQTDDGVKPLMPKELRPQFTTNAKLAEGFLKKYKIPIKPFREYCEWIVDGEPDDQGHLTGLLADHLKAVFAAKPALKRDLSIDDVWLDMIDTLRVWHKTENESKLAKIRQMIGKLQMPDVLVKNFQAEIKSQDPVIKELQTLVKKLTGKASVTIPMDEKDGIRANHPDEWKQYLALHRQLGQIYKDTLREHVRSKGGLADCEQVRKYFDAKKMAHRVPKGFTGLIDEDGLLYTKDGSVIPDSSNIDPGSKVIMNPDYSTSKDTEHGKNNNWYFKVVLPTKDADGNQNVQYKYTKAKLALNKSHKFELVQQMLKQEKNMVMRWRRDLKSKDISKQILAAQCELSYTTCARIGSKGNRNTTGETYGLTTLQVGNVKKRGGERILDYIGKDSVHQRHSIKPETPELKIVIKLLDMLCEGKKRSDNLFTYNGVTYGANTLRDYFKTVCPVPGSTPHKLRHLRGTRLAMGTLQEQLDELLPKTTVTQKAADDGFKKALGKVGDMLGHVRGVGETQKTDWSTAANNYVDVNVMGDYYAQLESFGIRVPNSLKKALGKK